ncbi:hypothetical protein T07_13110 [Trichinella nelsoni]|uniref:Reverse transcriptase domain-containing protein n=1 Tax=Trichinella nelsoni TaxID=6336 RepID=A0A0V0S0Z6_9BILA|nr:hypothetical protein T07_13110 [Trichinella nelsoni]
MYVDNLVLSCDSIEEVKKLVQDSKSLFRKVGFILTAFLSNSSGVLGYDKTLPFGSNAKPTGQI